MFVSEIAGCSKSGAQISGHAEGTVTFLVVEFPISVQWYNYRPTTHRSVTVHECDEPTNQRPKNNQLRHDAWSIGNRGLVFPARYVCTARLCCHKMVACLSVCPSHAGIVSKRLNIPPNFFHHRVTTPFHFTVPKPYCNITTRTT